MSELVPIEELLDVETRKRFRAKIALGSTEECWLWLAYVRPNGYGQFALRHGRPESAHRIAYSLWVGTLPAGLQIDHLCRNRACVNPAHLEAVTLQENLRRGEGTVPANRASAIARSSAQTCHRGHKFTPENTRIYRGHRHCRACARIFAQRYRDRKLSAA